MTPDRDIDRVLDAWLAPGPTEMPDRVYLGVLDRIERVPQRRTLRLITRFQPMPLPFKLATAAVLTLAIGIVVSPLATPPAPTNIQDASPSPAETPGLSPIPPELRKGWVGDYRVIEGLDNAADWAVHFTLLPIFSMGMGSAGKLDSVADIAPDGRLRLETTIAGNGCEVGDIGLYTWSLSERGTKLTIDSGEDACQTRADVMLGEFYTGDDCRVPDANFCLGPLDAGVHESVQFDLRGIGEDQIKWRHGAVTYDVPEGWANVDDGNYLFKLVPEADYEQLVNDPEFVYGDTIILHARPAALTTRDLCLPYADPSVGRSVDDLVAWLTAHPALDTGTPEPIIIDGFLGQVLDVDVASDWTQTCTEPGWEGTGPYVPLWFDANDLHNNPTDQLDRDDGHYGTGAIPGGATSDPIRMILLDAGAGDTLLIMVDSREAAGQAAFVEQAMPIVKKLQFPL